METKTIPCPKCNNALIMRDPNNYFCLVCELWNPHEWYEKPKKAVNDGVD